MTWLTWLPRVVAALLWYAKELVLANVAVTVDICTPGHRSDPVVVRYNTRCRTDLEIALLGVLITLTPGTLALATTRPDDRSGETASEGYDVYVHMMFPGDPDDLASLEELEGRMLGAVRREGAPSRSDRPARTEELG